MGQYHIVANLDKKQWLHPHHMGDGMKLLEFGCSREGTMTGLAILLATSNGKGGGDLHSNDSIIGSWAGDRIAIVGDYADEGEELGEVYRETHEEGSAWEDVSGKVLHAMYDDPYIWNDAKKQWVESEWTLKSVVEVAKAHRPLLQRLFDAWDEIGHGKDFPADALTVLGFAAAKAEEDARS